MIVNPDTLAAWDAEIPRSKAFSETFRNVKSTNSDLPKNVYLWLSAFYQNSEGSICQLENAGKAVGFV